MKRVNFGFPMLTRVKLENQKCSKTVNLYVNLMKVGKRRFLDIVYIHILKKIPIISQPGSAQIVGHLKISLLRRVNSPFSTTIYY